MWNGAGVKSLAVLVLISQDAPSETGTEGLAALGSHPQVARKQRSTP